MSSWTIWQRTENYPFAKENPQQHPHWQRHWDNRKPRLDEAQHRKLTQRINNQQCPLCPDITGTVKIGNYPLTTSDHKGAFYAASQGNADTHGQDASRGAPALGFSASNSNGIYGNSSTVRVPASYTLIIIRAQADGTLTLLDVPYIEFPEEAMNLTIFRC